MEQLGIWAERTGSGFHSKGQDADPAAVAWEAMDVAIRDQYDILFIDTAGRLHTKSNLMDELHKIREVIARKHPGAPHRSILIVDATTGQNGLIQAKQFQEAAGITGIVLTKLDGTAKGGAVIGIREELGDALFILCKIAQMSGVDPEDALHRACDKYQGRFRRVADAADRPLSAYTEAEKITLWEQAKEN